MFDKTINNLTYKDINELLYIRQVREGQRLDYKRDFHKDGKEFAKDTTAFANTDGGYIIYGIDEKQKIVTGISDNVGNGKIEDWITNVLNTNTDNSIDYEVKFINIDDETDPLFIVILYIKESNKKPIYVTAYNKSICYIRKGTSVFSAKPNDIREMYLKSNSTNGQTQVKVNQKAIIISRLALIKETLSRQTKLSIKMKLLQILTYISHKNKQNKFLILLEK